MWVSWGIEEHVLKWYVQIFQTVFSLLILLVFPVFDIPETQSVSWCSGPSAGSRMYQRVYLSSLIKIYYLGGWRFYGSECINFEFWCNRHLESLRELGFFNEMMTKYILWSIFNFMSLARSHCRHCVSCHMMIYLVWFILVGKHWSCYIVQGRHKRRRLVGS